MFSSEEYLIKKTGPDGIGRLSYLQSLVTEFQDTSDEESKEQILANLSNFAYDPINYGYFKKLNVVDIFLDSLAESNEKLVEFAIAGICNCCLDNELKEHILSNDGVDFVIACLSKPEMNTVMSAITSLMYLMTPKSQPAINSLPVVECMLRFSECNNKQISNLASVFLQDYCSSDHVKEARKVQIASQPFFPLQAS